MKNLLMVSFILLSSIAISGCGGSSDTTAAISQAIEAELVEKTTIDPAKMVRSNSSYSKNRGR